MVANAFENVHNFDTATSIPDLPSKVIIVTGGNSGVGKESVLQLAKHKPKKLYLAARSKSKFDVALADIIKVVPDASSHVHFLELDLSSFDSIKSATDKFLSENDRLDVLMNNAGTMANPPGLTTEGYEIQFGTNHMGTAFFTKLLLPTLLKTAAEPESDVRVIILTSNAIMMAPGRSGLPFLDSESKNADIKTPNAGHRWSYTRYGCSKLANTFHARKLAEIYGDKGITAVSVHPGRVATNLLGERFTALSPTGWFQSFADLLMGPLTVEKGAMNQLWGATAEKSQLLNGGFYVPVGVLMNISKGKEKVHQEVSQKLWDWQEREFDAWLSEHR